MSQIFDTEDFINAFYYDGTDLGVTYTKESTNLRVWAPTASCVKVNLYREGDGDNLIETIEMIKDIKGTWILTLHGDYDGVYYTYLVTVNQQTNEAVDPYVRTTGVNGKRGMILSLEKTNPDGFQSEKKPDFVNMTDAIIYELHIRDLSMDKESGIQNKGKFLGLTEDNTVNNSGKKTGLAHIKELGITHLHLLPAFDYCSVDESKLDIPQFNWGYDPENYNVPEGSYATDPYHGEVRVNEMKQMVQALHANGIRVVMDVVYNHTAKTIDSNFNKIVPDYYYRKNGDEFSNASACGNETASERAMFRKFMVDSVTYWAKEYHIDGFRFDLMGVHDITTMNAIRTALNQIDDTIIIYGEGWTGGTSTLPEEQRAMKKYTFRFPGIACFSDDMRDGIKGSVFYEGKGGFVTGGDKLEETIKFGVVAATYHTQINFNKVNYSKSYWAGSPSQCINYTSAHDNLTLWDKICMTNPDASYETKTRMNKLCAAIVLTSQGIPFFQAGEEMLRTKPLEGYPGKFDENSYMSSDETNSIKWGNKEHVMDVYSYYQGLIRFRKEQALLRMTSSDEIEHNLQFINTGLKHVVAYRIQSVKDHEKEAETLIIIYNANPYSVEISIGHGIYQVYVDGEHAGNEVIDVVKGNCVQVQPISCIVLVKNTEKVQALEINKTKTKKKIVIASTAAVIVGTIGILLLKRRK